MNRDAKGITEQQPTRFRLQAAVRPTGCRLQAAGL